MLKHGQIKEGKSGVNMTKISISHLTRTFGSGKYDENISLLLDLEI